MGEDALAKAYKAHSLNGDGEGDRIDEGDLRVHNNDEGCAISRCGRRRTRMKTRERRTMGARAEDGDESKVKFMWDLRGESSMILHVELPAFYST